MSVVSVSELKARLSHYLREVRRGGEVQIVDRGVPIATLSGVNGADTAGPGQRDRLVASGLLRPRARTTSGVLDEPPLRAGIGLAAAVDDDRGERV